MRFSQRSSERISFVITVGTHQCTYTKNGEREMLIRQRNRSELMTHRINNAEVRSCAGIESASRQSGTRGGILQRVLSSISEWDRTQADQEIGRFLTRSGGRFTDDVERQMMQRATLSSWGVRR
jgi:hypothetical protein